MSVYVMKKNVLIVMNVPYLLSYPETREVKKCSHRKLTPLRLK